MRSISINCLVCLCVCVWCPNFVVGMILMLLLLSVPWFPSYTREAL